MTAIITGPGEYRRQAMQNCYIVGKGRDGLWRTEWGDSYDDFGVIAHKPESWSEHNIIGPWIEPRKLVEGWTVVYEEPWATIHKDKATAESIARFAKKARVTYARELPESEWPKEEPPTNSDRYAYWNSLPEEEKAKIREDWQRDMYGDSDGLPSD